MSIIDLLFFQSEQRAPGPMPQGEMMMDNSTRDETDMSALADGIPIESVCSTCKTTGMTTDKGVATDTEMTTVAGYTETGLTTATEGTDYCSCQPTKNEGKSAWWSSGLRRTSRAYCYSAIRGSSPGSSSNSKVTGSCQEGVSLSRLLLVASRRHVGCPLSKDI